MITAITATVNIPLRAIFVLFVFIFYSKISKFLAKIWFKLFEFAVGEDDKNEEKKKRRTIPIRFTCL